MRVIYEVIVDAIATVLLFIKDNLMNFANILNFLLPFTMYFIGQNVGINAGKIVISPEIIVPIFILFLIYLFKGVANKIGKGITVPVPEKRFTEIGDEGEVSVENKRLQELLLYTADLEDWLERKGLM